MIAATALGVCPINEITDMTKIKTVVFFAFSGFVEVLAAPVFCLT